MKYFTKHKILEFIELDKDTGNTSSEVTFGRNKALNLQHSAFEEPIYGKDHFMDTKHCDEFDTLLRFIKEEEEAYKNRVHHVVDVAKNSLDSVAAEYDNRLHALVQRVVNHVCEYKSHGTDVPNAAPPDLKTHANNNGNGSLSPTKLRTPEVAKADAATKTPSASVCTSRSRRFSTPNSPFVMASAHFDKSCPTGTQSHVGSGELMLSIHKAFARTLSGSDSSNARTPESNKIQTLVQTDFAEVSSKECKKSNSAASEGNIHGEDCAQSGRSLNKRKRRSPDVEILKLITVPPIRMSKTVRVVRDHTLYCFPSDTRLQFIREENLPFQKIWAKAMNVHSDDVPKFWYRHQVPNELTFLSSEIQRQFDGFTMFGSNTISAVVRLLQYKQTSLYTTYSLKSAQWRHYLPPEWTEAAIAGDNALEDINVEKLFIGEHLDSKPEHCQLIVVPVISPGSWSCYVWDFKDQLIHVLDPVNSMQPKTVLESIHIQWIRRLHISLVKCSEMFFAGWKLRRQLWDINYHVGISSECSSVDSGLYTAHIMEFFSGGKLIVELKESDISRKKSRLMYEILTTPGNTAALPCFFLNYVNSDSEESSPCF